MYYSTTEQQRKPTEYSQSVKADTRMKTVHLLYRLQFTAEPKLITP